MPIRGDIKLEYEKMFFETGLYVPTREIYLGSHSFEDEYGESGIDFMSSEFFIKSLKVLEANSNEAITVYYNQIGGEWTHGIAIYDYIKASPCHITIIGSGCVRSMGTIIMQSADERLLTLNTRWMIHDGFDGFGGIPKSFIATAEEAKLTLTQMYEIYYDATKKWFDKQEYSEKRALKQIEQWCQADKYFSAEESVEMGFVDGIHKREDTE